MSGRTELEILASTALTLAGLLHYAMPMLVLGEHACISSIKADPEAVTDVVFDML
jgi:hypothetical protein